MARHGSSLMNGGLTKTNKQAARRIARPSASAYFSLLQHQRSRRKPESVTVHIVCPEYCVGSIVRYDRWLILTAIREKMIL